MRAPDPTEAEAATQHVRLSASRLSLLRHDLRTPFNQIIGYAEMVGEDASSDECVECAQILVHRSNGVLEEMTAELAGAPEAMTREYLHGFRGRLAAGVDTLLKASEALRIAAGDTSGIPETGRNLDSIAAAIASFRPLLARVEQGHDAEVEGAEPLLVPAAGEAASAAPPTGAAPAAKGSILIVDDQAANRDVLRQRLDREGFQTFIAEDGPSALARLTECGAVPVDLVLLDMMMPGMDGQEVLRRIKETDGLKQIPVIMISGMSETARVVQCIEGGAEDYVTKPFNPVLLRARIGIALERKRFHDEEQRQRAELRAANEELASQRENVHRLLLNILPERVAADLQQGHSAPMYFEDTTICFTDFVGFTLSTERMAAEQVVEELHIYFTAFDHVMERYGLEKLKTIGDSYMFASGLPKRHPANPVNAVLAAQELVEETRRLSARPAAPAWQIRVGLHTGPVIAGVVGIRKFAFDVWGDTVNFASRMESSGAPGCINISERTYSRVKDFFLCEARGKVLTKDKREVDMFFVRAIQPSLLANGNFDSFSRRYRLYFSQEPSALPLYPGTPEPDSKGDPA